MDSKETLKAAADVLEAAALVISTGDWWTQGCQAKAGAAEVGAHNPDADCFCALGALDAATPSRLQVYRIARDACFELVRCVALFNDTPGRTAEEVASLMFDAADSLRGRV